MVAYLVDTGILVRHLRGRKAVVRLLRELGSRDRLAISAVTRTEILAGMRRSEDRSTRRLLARLETVPVDREIADRAGTLIRRARGRGRTLHVVDALIGATAAQQGITLLTLNIAHFEGLGLSLYPLPDLQTLGS
jgi:predicted nucleic acid-binding protein